MANVNMAYAASSALTITLAALASDTNFLTGRASNVVDNTTLLYLDYLLAGKITTGTTPTTGREIRVYVVGLMEDSTYPDVFDGTNAGKTVSSAGTRDSVCKLAAVMATGSTSDQAYYFGPISVAALFGGVLPKKFQVFVVHSTAVNLNATSANQAIYVTGTYNTVT